MDIRNFFQIKKSNSNSSFKTNQNIQSSKIWKVYTDGSTINNGKKGSYGGIGVFFGDNNPMNISEPMICNENVTNNICELQACNRAIKKIIDNSNFKNNDTIIIGTDSQYLINCIVLWSNTWEKNGWMRNNNGKMKPVKNKNIIQSIKRNYLKYNIQFKYIKAHTVFYGEKKGENYEDWYGNKKADELAVLGSKQN